MTTRDQIARLDAADPLARFRERFVIDDPETIYLDGNSLGRLPTSTRDRVQQLVGEWGTRLITAWDVWIDLPTRVGDALAAAALGARPGEVIVSDSTTVNLFKLAWAATDGAREGQAIVTDRGNFPTDRYVLDGVARRRGLELRQFDADPIEGPRPEDVAEACGDGQAALVSLSHVSYRSGALADLERITAMARDHGARVLWDLSHSVGAVPIRLKEACAELAVGCTYKYLNAGPGAPAFLFLDHELQRQLATPIQGWFGQRDQFAMERDYDPEPGIRAFLAGTPPVLDLTAVECGVELLAEAGIEGCARKATALTSLIVDLHDEWLAPLGFELGTPRDPARRGGHVSLRHPQAWQITRAMIESARVIPDFRGPDSIRLGVPPLYTRFADVYEALDRVRALVAGGEHERFDPTPARIT
ncbi:MAG TPA: kynureninase [Thermoleophilaceae bacterium]